MYSTHTLQTLIKPTNHQMSEALLALTGNPGKVLVGLGSQQTKDISTEQANYWCVN